MRILIFSDYTTRNPILPDGAGFHHPTTSIRYTLADDWLVLKGKRKEFGYYLANAKLLIGEEYYSGENFSSGDLFIKTKAAHHEAYQRDPSIKGTGGTEDWIFVAINHHLSLVVDQLSTHS